MLKFIKEYLFIQYRDIKFYFKYDDPLRIINPIKYYRYYKATQELITAARKVKRRPPFIVYKSWANGGGQMNIHTDGKTLSQIHKENLEWENQNIQLLSDLKYELHMKQKGQSQ